MSAEQPLSARPQPRTGDAGPADTPLLRAAGVTVRRDGRDVVRDVDLDLHPGEMVALLGPNGAGKSTLLDALAGALEPAKGRIECRGRVAVALQSPDLARRSVLANLVLALSWWGVPRAERVPQARAALDRLGAAHLAGRPAAALSGGERRRVHLARVLAVAPDVLMLDEPFAGLDAAIRAGLLADAIPALRAADRATLIVVHDRAEAWAFADRLLILIDGRLVADGTPRQLLVDPPTPQVARFLGYDGALREGDTAILTRPPHVVLDPQGPISARVLATVALEDGFRLELEVEGGRLFAVAGLDAPQRGETIGVALRGGARFAAADALDAFGMLGS